MEVTDVVGVPDITHIAARDEKMASASSRVIVMVPRQFHRVTASISNTDYHHKYRKERKLNCRRKRLYGSEAWSHICAEEPQI
jgi:hypothetical protein